MCTDITFLLWVLFFFIICVVAPYWHNQHPHYVSTAHVLPILIFYILIKFLPFSGAWYNVGASDGTGNYAITCASYGDVSVADTIVRVGGGFGVGVSYCDSAGVIYP